MNCFRINLRIDLAALEVAAVVEDRPDRLEPLGVPDRLAVRRRLARARRS